jgi:hypothetical protein
VSEDTIFLWDAGPVTGTAGTAEGAFEAAAPCLAPGTEGLVEEARVVMVPCGPAGSVPEHRRTGRRWRGRLENGKPSWAQAAARGTAEGA